MNATHAKRILLSGILAALLGLTPVSASILSPGLYLLSPEAI